MNLRSSGCPPAALPANQLRVICSTTEHPVHTHSQLARDSYLATACPLRISNIARLLFPSPGRSTAAKSTRSKEPTPSSNQAGHPHQFRIRICRTRSRREFCTSVHRFAQSCEQNFIDGANGKHYLARQIEPGSFRTLRINLEGAASLTAAAPRD